MENQKVTDNHFKPEQNLFLNIISDFINKKSSHLPDSLSWDALLDIAYKHEAVAILFYQVQKQLKNSDISKNQKATLMINYADVVHRYEKRQTLLNEIDTEFNRNNILYFIFKGIEIANLYPNPKLRTMGDSDILIHKKDEIKAHKCLLNLGCEIDTIGVNEWQYHRNDIHLELHRKMMNNEEANSKEQISFFNNRWEYAAAEPNSTHCHLDWSYHFIYVLTHLRKHFINSGVGFRQFMDVAVIAKECSLDWKLIQKELTAMNMWEFSKCCFAFCEKWFGIKFPIEVATISEDFYIESTSRIFEGGTFGTYDSKNAANYEIYKIRKNIRISPIITLLEKIRLIFPSYFALKYTPHYSFVDKKPYLVPFAWVYRGYRFISGKVTNDKKQYIVNLIEEQKDYRNAMLDQWKIV